MSLILPTVGQEPGPNWALDLNSSLSLVDQHNHTSGSGVQITPAGMNINVDLPFNGNDATGLRSARFDVQGSPLSGGLDIGCIYVSGQDLYYNDTLGNQIQLTASGAVNGTPGSIGNLIAPAAVTYVPANQTFVFQSNQTNATPAALDGGPVLIRNITAASNYIRLQANPVLPGNYSITLPSSLPASQQFMTINSLGNVISVAADNSTVEIAANILQVKDAGITLAKMAANSVDTSQIVNSAVTNAKMAANSVSTANVIALNVTEPKVAQFPYLKLTRNVGTYLFTIGGYRTLTSGTFTISTARNLLFLVSGTGSNFQIGANGGEFNYKITITSSFGTHYDGYFYNGTPYNIPFGTSGSTNASFSQMIELPGAATYTVIVQASAPTQNLLVTENNFQLFCQVMP
jgi:hypothetical protein